MTTAATVAKERQLDWLLGEAVGALTATGLRTSTTNRRGDAGQRWLAAALATLAVSAAFGVAWLRSDAAKAPVQQGEPEWRDVHDVRELDALPLDTRALRCFDFDDAAIAALTKFAKLEQLDLSAMAVNAQGYAVSLKITDAGLLHLGKLPALRWLSLATCHQIRGTGLPTLENLPQLEYLDLTYTGVESPAVERLQRLPSLRELRLSHCMAFHGRSLAEVAKIPGLRRLMLQGCTTLAAADVQHLAKLRELRYLDLRDCQGRFRGQTLSFGDEPQDSPKPDGIGITDASIQALASLPLEWLLLGGSESLTDAIGATLAAMPGLRSLDLSNLPKTTGNLLAQLPRGLVSLNLDGNPQLDGAALRRLPAMPALNELGLAGLPALVDDDVAAVLDRVHLQVLRLGGQPPAGKSAAAAAACALTAAVAPVLARQQDLRRLDIAYAQWTDATAMEHIAGLPKLAELVLAGSSAWTRDQLRPLAKSASLRSLSLLWCIRLDATGLGALTGASLQDLDLYGTNLQPAEIHEVAKAWPGCKIRMPRGQRHVVPRER